MRSKMQFNFDYEDAAPGGGCGAGRLGIECEILYSFLVDRPALWVR